MVLQVGIVGSFYMAGTFFASALSGKLCDIIGRKWTTIIVCLTMAGGQALGGVSPSYESFVAFRFFTAVGKFIHNISTIFLCDSVFDLQELELSSALSHQA